VVASWLIALAFAAALLTAGATFGRTQFLGTAVLSVVSVVFILYAVAWLFLGGVEDAGNYWPALVLGLAFVVYATYVSYKVAG
jgi:hypothetical protein